MNIGFLASGKLGFTTLSTCRSFCTPVFIATDKKSETIISFAQENKTPLFIGNPREGKLKEFLERKEIDLLFSVNYLFIIEKDILEFVKYPINLHGSLLPKYRGRTPHVWAIINNESMTGVTAHLMVENCDAGGIILQKEVEIDLDDTGATVLSKFEAIYPDIIKQIINMISDSTVKISLQDNSKASYFNKRTLEDGKINWDWQKERIRNWVRAQAKPYPGAFTELGCERIIIDSVKFSDFGFKQEYPNGLILSDHPDIIVKTSNGTINLDSVRTNRKLLKKNIILGK